jgi:hypothetical protein
MPAHENLFLEAIDLTNKEEITSFIQRTIATRRTVDTVM